MSALSTSHPMNIRNSMRRAMLGLEPAQYGMISVAALEALLQSAEEAEQAMLDLVRADKIKTAVMCAIVQGGAALDLMPRKIFTCPFVQRCIIGEPALHLMHTLDYAIAEHLCVQNGSLPKCKL